MKELRIKRGWTAEKLAERCDELHMPKLNRSVIANIESGRRKFVTVDEMFTLAYALDVAPIHLLVPIDEDASVTEHLFSATPDRFLPIGPAREWARGRWCPPGLDPRVYFSEVPRSEWEPPTMPTAEEVEEQGARVQTRREIADAALGRKARG